MILIIQAQRPPIRYSFLVIWSIVDILPKCYTILIFFMVLSGPLFFSLSDILHWLPMQFPQKV